jgi:hypothetical protein
MDFASLITVLADLFGLVFGSNVLVGMFGMMFILVLGWKLQLSADGWIVTLITSAIVFSNYYFQDLGLIPLALLIIGAIIYLAIRKYIR